MGRLHSGYYKALVLTLSSLVLGCNGAQGTGGNSSQTSTAGTTANASQTAPTRVTIQAAGTTFKSGEPAVLRIIPSSKQFDLSFVGVSETDPNHSWAAAARLTADQIQARSGTIAIANTPAGPGATIQSAGPASTASSGSVQVSLDPAHFSGSTAVLPDSLAASFVGDMVVSCWVPKASLPGATNNGGTVGSDGSEALVSDEGFVTSQCAPFASLVKGQ